MRKFFITLAILPFVAACSVDDAEYAEINEIAYAWLNEDGHLNLDDDSVFAPAEGGSLRLKVLSNGDVTITPLYGEIPDWITLDGDLSFHGDGVITATMELNEGFRRGLSLKAEMDGAEPLIIVIRQGGVTPALSCASPYMAVKGSSASEGTFDIETNIPLADLTSEVRYSDGNGEWLGTPTLSNGQLNVTTTANVGNHSRKATLLLSYKDGWNVLHELELYVTQASSNDLFGTPVSFEEIRSMATEDGAEAQNDITLCGIVVSDCKSANMEDNPTLTLDEAGDFCNTKVSSSVRESVMQVVDTTASARTAYLESSDGAYGVRLVFTNPADNHLRFGTGLTISLDGTKLIRENNPERYTIYGLSADNMIESVPDQPVPFKERSISTLKDTDLYTFVSLKNVEFPVKEGSYTDIRENHALWSQVNDASVSATDSKRYFYMDGYAATLIDTEGKLICAPVNMLCPWRKPENGIPQGAGTASGILVHNNILRYGNAGRYQIRVIDESGFSNLAESASAWTTLAGWDRGSLTPSFGEAKMFCDKPDATVTNEHSYKSRIAATGRTCGISDTYRSIRVSSPVSGWYQWAEDGSVEAYNGLCMNISTENISGSIISVAFRFYAGRSGTASTFQAFPAHWCVDYSTNNGETWTQAQNAIDSSLPYVHLRSIATYTLQYGSYKIPTPTRAGLGASEHLFTLPDTVFGLSSVLIRIRPYDTVMSTIPTLFLDETENSSVHSDSSVQDHVSFQDIFVRYR